MAPRAPLTRATKTTPSRTPPTFSPWPSRRNSRPRQETDDPPAPPTRRPGRRRTPNRPGRRMAQDAAFAALGFGPQGRPASGTEEPRDEPDVDVPVDPVLGRPGGSDLRAARRRVRHRALEVATGSVASWRP